MSDAEIDRLPDPELWVEARLLASRGTFTPRDLDAMDAELYLLTRRFLNV